MNSAKFEELEKKVKKIKTKRYIKVFLLFCLLSFAGYFMLIQFERTKKSIKKVEVKKEPKKVVRVKKEIEKKSVKEVEIESKVTKKDSNLTTVKNIEKKATYDTIKLYPVITIDKQQEKKPIKPKNEKRKNLFVKEKKKIDLVVKEVKSEDALIERFKVAGDYESAISLARLYFEKKNYNRVVLWAKKASKIKPKEDEAWLLFAKAKYAMNKKDEAIKALELYKEYFKSKNIERLLFRYRSEK